MQSKWLAVTGCCTVALAFGVSACGGDDKEPASTGTPAAGGTATAAPAAKDVTIYSSVPLQGASRASTEALVNGAKLAVEQANNKAGDINVKYVPLDDSTAQAGNWTPEAESANARKAAGDDSTAVYVGTFNSGAAAISIPILNEAGIPMISPANTYVGLTTPQLPGEPDKYYPNGTRNYTRIVPRDTIQGAALVTLMKQDSCTKLAMVNDKEVYGQGLATQVETAAKAQGLEISGNDAIDKNAPNYRSLAEKAKAAGADCFLFAGVTANNAIQATKDFASALGPESKIYGPDGTCESAWVNSKTGIPAALDSRTKCTVATLAADQYPAAGQEFFKAYTAKYGVENPDPYAIYGYEAMSLALDAIKRSGTGDKADVLKALFATKDRDSVLGVYSIDENGDTTLTDYGVYKVVDGEIVYDQTIKAAVG